MFVDDLVSRGCSTKDADKAGAIAAEIFELGFDGIDADHDIEILKLLNVMMMMMMMMILMILMQCSQRGLYTAQAATHTNRRRIQGR
jgi:hypothetical protein